MWAVYGLLALLGLVILVVLLLLFVPVFGRVAYDGEFSAHIRVLGIPITLSPRPEKKVKEPKKKAKKKAKKDEDEQVDEDKPSKWEEIKDLFKQDGVGATLRFLVEVAGLACRTVGKALKAVTIRELKLFLLIATDDAATTAQWYGRVCGILYPALTTIEQTMRVKHHQVRVEPNFLLEQGMVRFDVRFRVAVWRLLGAGFTLLWGLIKLRDNDTEKTAEEHLENSQEENALNENAETIKEAD